MDQQKILIIGAAGGLGAALASQLADKGADLLLVDKKSRELDALSDHICSKGLSEPGICIIDLASAGNTEYESLADIMETQYGGLDVVFHCAAAFAGLQPMDQISAFQWQECMQVNVNSAWLATINLLPLLKAARAGRVVFILEDEQVSGSAYWGAYGVSKAALLGFSKILQQELDGTTVDVLSFSPGPMRTGLRAKAYLAEDPNTVQDPAIAAKKLIEQLENSIF